MGLFIRKYNNRNEAILKAGNAVLPKTYFNLLHLNATEELLMCVPEYETIYTILSGCCDIVIDNQFFEDLHRRDIWTERSDSVYVPPALHVKIKCRRDNTEIVVAGGQCNEVYSPFRVTPENVTMIEVGTSSTKTYRKIFDVLGNKEKRKTGNLVVKELFAEDGCWSGYPPHKHDTEALPDESAFEELYYYRFNPEDGFGNQLIFQDDESSESYMVRTGDAVCIDKGYHPTVFSPGHKGYLLCVLVGKIQPSLILNLHKKYSYLADCITGVKEMRETFKKN